MMMHKYTLPAESNEMLTTRQWDPKHTILSKWYNSKYKCIFAKILSTNLFKNIIFTYLRTVLNKPSVYAGFRVNLYVQ